MNFLNNGNDATIEPKTIKKHAIHIAWLAFDSPRDTKRRVESKGVKYDIAPNICISPFLTP